MSACNTPRGPTIAGNLTPRTPVPRAESLDHHKSPMVWSPTSDKLTSVSSCCKRARRGVRRMKPRHKLLRMFVVAEMVVLGGLCLQLWSLRASIDVLFLQTATRQINLLEMTYLKKTQELEFLCQSDTQISTVLDFVKGTGSRAAVRSLLMDEATHNSLEYMTLLATNGSILVNAGTVNRTGRHWDPQGMVARVIKYPKRGQLGWTGLVTWDELSRQEGAGVYRERTSRLSDMDFTHPYDTHADSLIRYTVTPVWSNGNGTGKVLAVLVAGDIVNGKTKILSIAVKAFKSGYGGLFSLDTTRHKFIRASSTYAEQAKFANHLTYTATYDPVENGLQKHLLVPASLQRGTVITHLYEGMAYAAKAIPKSRWNTTDINDTPQALGVLVRGLPVNEASLFERVALRASLSMLALVLLNLIFVWAAWVAFIRPLEHAAVMLKNARKVDLSEIASLRMYAHFTARVVLSVAVSIACIAVMGWQVRSGMQRSVLASTLSEIGVATAGFDFQSDLMYSGFRSEAANDPAVLALITNPLDFAARNATKKLFKADQSQRKLEFGFLLDANMKIIWSVNKRRIGEVYNPDNMTAQTLATNKVWKLSTVMSYDDFIRESPPIYHRHRYPAPNSLRTPYTTKAPCLVRWITIPVYKPSNVDRVRPDGVLIKGDLVNGKTVSMERVVQAVSVGYAGAFVWDGSKFVMVVSVMKTDTWYTDVEVRDEVLHRCRNSGGNPAIMWDKIAGRDWALSAIPVNPNRLLDSWGDVEQSMNLQAFIVYGKPKAVTNDVANQQSLYLFVCLALQVTAMLAVCATSYQPLNILLGALEKHGFLKRSERPTIAKVFQFYVLLPLAACAVAMPCACLKNSRLSSWVVKHRAIAAKQKIAHSPPATRQRLVQVHPAAPKTHLQFGGRDASSSLHVSSSVESSVLQRDAMHMSSLPNASMMSMRSLGGGTAVTPRGPQQQQQQGGPEITPRVTPPANGAPPQTAVVRRYSKDRVESASAKLSGSLARVNSTRETGRLDEEDEDDSLS